MAYAWNRTRMGGWRVAQSPILGTTITINRLKKRGYINLIEYYQKVSTITEPPSTACPVLYGKARIPRIGVVFRQKLNRTVRGAIRWHLFISGSVYSYVCETTKMS